MFEVEFKGNEEYFSQLSSGTQSLPKASYCLIRQGPKSSVSLGPVRSVNSRMGRQHIATAMYILHNQADGLQVADYLLARLPDASADELDNLLIRNKSAWTVGIRAGRRGLTRRVIVGG